MKVENLENRIENARAAHRYRFDHRIIEALPLGRIRNIDNLALLLPGVSPRAQTFGNAGPGFAPGLGTSGQFAVNGLRPRDNTFTIDGADNNDEDVGVRRQGFLASLPQSMESIAEFEVITILPDARYGRNIGGQVNVVSKTGGLGLHGAAYGFLSNSRFKSFSPFDQVALDAGTPSKDQNPFTSSQAGLTLGGPFPKSDFFFYSSYERIAQRASEETHFAMPTLKERGFRGCGGRALPEPNTKQFFPGCVDPGTPSSLAPLSTAGAAAFSLFPLPNNPTGPYEQNTFTEVLPADGTSHIFSTKLERRVGSQLLTGRYHITVDDVSLPAVGGAVFSALNPRIQTQNAVAMLSGAVTDRTANNFRFSYARTLGWFHPTPHSSWLPSESFPGTPFLLNAPLMPIGSQAIDPEATTEPITGPLGRVTIAGFSPVGLDPFHFPQRRRQSTFQFADTFTWLPEGKGWLKGGHTLHLGFDIRQRRFKNDVERNTRPDLVFGGLRMADSRDRRECGLVCLPEYQQIDASALDMAAAGVPLGLFQTIGETDDFSLKLRKSRADIFVHDSWQVRPNLRVSSGLRFGLSRIPKDLDGNRFENAFDAARIAADAQAATEACGRLLSAGLVNARCEGVVNEVKMLLGGDRQTKFGADKFDFDPRVAFAWRPPIDSRII